MTSKCPLQLKTFDDSMILWSKHSICPTYDSQVRRKFSLLPLLGTTVAGLIEGQMKICFPLSKSGNLILQVNKVYAALATF